MVLALSSLLAAISLLFLVSVRQERRDQRAFRNALHFLARGKGIPPRLHFANRRMAELWRSVLSLLARNHGTTTEKPLIEDVLTVGSRIVGASDNISTVAKEVCELVLEQTKPDVLASAIVLRDPTTGELTLEHILGAPRQRIEMALLMQFDALFDDAGRTWGYNLAESECFFDYSVFNIGATLSTPLRSSQGVCGALWLGFKLGSATMSAHRRAFVQAIATHAASSFYAAVKVEQRTRQTSNERDFLLGLSHDLRAPGNSALYALSDLISGELGTLTPDQHLRLSAIQQGLEDQLAILGDVLDFAKHQRGFLEARTQRISIERALAETIQGFSLSAERKGLKLWMDSIPSASLSVDPRHLQRILANFLSNAVKYTEEGEIRVEFAVSADAVDILVSDTGIGIPDSERHLLFKEFRRLGNSGREQGFGLGLALTKALADLNRTTVFYRPNSKGGSTFGVTVPLARAEEEGDSFSIGRVLVVDDDPAACRTNIRYLRDICYSVTPAGSVQEALDLAKRLQPDLIVSDLNLSDGTGVELIEKLSQLGMNLPTVIITGSGQAELELSRLTSTPPLSILEKPTTRTALINGVRALVEASSLQVVRAA